MNLTKVYRIPKFKKANWLKNTLILIQTKEKNAVNSFEEILLKLMNNCVCGKTMGNLRKRVKFRLAKNAKIYKKICKQIKFFFTEDI